MKTVQAEYVVGGRLGMISAIGEQQEIKIWDYIIASDEEHFFWPSEYTEPGSMIHCGMTIRAGRKKSEGYGGRVMPFPTKDGVIEIQGPWHTNSDHLFKATGVDLRDKHLTFGCIAMQRDHGKNYETIFRDVIYIDQPQGVIGQFKRIESLAVVMADEIGEPVFYYSRSHGGSSDGPVFPTSWTEKQKRDHFRPNK